MADMKGKWRERRRLGLTQFRRRGGLPIDAHPSEIAPIRILCGAFEILGDVVIRPMRPALPSLAPAADTRPAPAPIRAPVRPPWRRRSECVLVRSPRRRPSRVDRRAR
jgi:hypothetical protein